MSETIFASIITAIVSIVSALLLALPGLRAFRNQQKKDIAESRKTDAETSKIFSDLAAESVKREMEKSGEFFMLQKRLDTLEHEFCEVIDILSDWADGFDTLVGQLQKENITPSWQPDPTDIAKIKEFKKRR